MSIEHGRARPVLPTPTPPGRPAGPTQATVARRHRFWRRISPRPPVPRAAPAPTRSVAIRILRPSRPAAPNDRPKPADSSAARGAAFPHGRSHRRQLPDPLQVHHSSHHDGVWPLCCPTPRSKTLSTNCPPGNCRQGRSLARSTPRHSRTPSRFFNASRQSPRPRIIIPTSTFAGERSRTRFRHTRRAVSRNWTSTLPVELTYSSTIRSVSTDLRVNKPRNLT